MPNCADTARLSPDERLCEAAAILAVGVLRLRQRAALPPEETLENPVELPAVGLEVPAGTAVGVLGKAGRGEKRNDLAVRLASLGVRWYLT